MPNIIDWPANLKIFGLNLPYLERNVSSAGISLSRQERVVAADTGIWRYKFRTMLWDRRGSIDTDRYLSFRALMALSEGRLNVIRVPIYDPHNVWAQNSLIDSLGSYPNGISHSDGAFFSDGAGYEMPGLGAVLLSPAASGATSLLAVFDVGVTPQIGQFFSDGNNLYIVKKVSPQGSNSFRISFLPRLRTALSQAAGISFTKLFCSMRLVNEDAQHASMSANLVADIDLDFSEALT